MGSIMGQSAGKDESVGKQVLFRQTIDDSTSEEVREHNSPRAKCVIVSRPGAPDIITEPVGNTRDWHTISYRKRGLNIKKFIEAARKASVRSPANETKSSPPPRKPVPTEPPTPSDVGESSPREGF